ncbi:hypothetical protein CSQ85_12670 [Bifidobacterium rousetti]|nr:hypothetical protein CSQ85_12670 [Bifidobacterium rousetti]
MSSIIIAIITAMITKLMAAMIRRFCLIIDFCLRGFSVAVMLEQSIAEETDFGTMTQFGRRQ